MSIPTLPLETVRSSAGPVRIFRSYTGEILFDLEGLSFSIGGVELDALALAVAGELISKQQDNAEVELDKALSAAYVEAEEIKEAAEELAADDRESDLKAVAADFADTALAEADLLPGWKKKIARLQEALEVFAKQDWGIE